MAGGEYQGQRNSIGSYGFALNNLAEGLSTAFRVGWITEDEAKDEFRSHVTTIQEKEARVMSDLNDEEFHGYDLTVVDLQEVPRGAGGTQMYTGKEVKDLESTSV